ILEKAKYEEKIKKGNGEYTFMFRNVTKKVDSIAKYIEENPDIISKINLHHENEEDRADTRKLLSDFDLELAYSEHFSLECTNKGVSKATGLIKLCEYLNINIEDTIAVGDAENDYAVLSTAGLSVAMGNAKESIKKICDVIVADNKHDGCAEAVEKYLLK
ncbi:MAG: HAD-IIB family hydrolase, partial [Treponema sp.]|nr:HAD-IIB family hydrolase [Treponema sp.]